MSLCATCKAWNIDPFAYLRDALDRVSTHPMSRIEELLPDRWKPVEAADPPGRIRSLPKGGCICATVGCCSVMM